MRRLWASRPSVPTVMVGALVMVGAAVLLGASVLLALVLLVVVIVGTTAANAYLHHVEVDADEADGR